MPLSAPPSPRRLTLGAGFLFMTALVGCGATGTPVARHPVTPEPVGDLGGQQRGDAVVLSFTMPSQSTDKHPLPEMPTVEIYRRSIAAGVPIPKATGTAATPTTPAIPTTPTICLPHLGRLPPACVWWTQSPRTYWSKTARTGEQISNSRTPWTPRKPHVRRENR